MPGSNARRCAHNEEEETMNKFLIGVVDLKNTINQRGETA